VKSERGKKHHSHQFSMRKNSKLKFLPEAGSTRWIPLGSIKISQYTLETHFFALENEIDKALKTTKQKSKVKRQNTG
jgi:hypothetical protein